MLPLQQAEEVRTSILEYIKATYRFKDKNVSDAFYDFIEDTRHGMIKGPYISLKTPFVTSPAGSSVPLEIKPDFPPYQHQMESFQRLTTEDGHRPQNTLLTTGTGSGKTECFQFPVLDYCYKNRLLRGIKAIILYPMNALATDQAGRLAKAIFDDPRLQGQVTAGLFIGRGDKKMHLSTTMTREHIIEDTETILSNPPDILLTNFKMLDYGLLRHNYQRLWNNNRKEKNTLLKYLVLDELHTYDGAQGTDVANLIRRLKLKLSLPNEHLCCIGTSATMGSEDDAKDALCKFASDVFGEHFATDSIIEEHRQRVDEFLNSPINDPNAFEAKNLASQSITRDLLSITSEAKVIHIEDLVKQLSDKNSEFGRLSEREGKRRPRYERLSDLLALISRAKVEVGGRKRPYLPLQVQIWIRELSGIRRIVSMEPKFVWRLEKYDGIAMPAWFCRECGASGWVMIKGDNEDAFRKDCEEAGRFFMTNNKNTYLVNTNTPDAPHQQADDYSGVVMNKCFIDPDTFTIREPKKEKDTDLSLIAYNAEERKGSGGKIMKEECPECCAIGDSVSIIGTKVATLASLSISQILASDLDQGSDNERKVLAFTNEVQDAAHESAFFEARNYRFTFRASIQKVISKYGRTMTLTELEDTFVKFWKQQFDEKSYVMRFFPPDCEGRINKDTDYQTSKGHYEANFIREFDLRLTWEVWAEMTLNSMLGRTLQKTGTSATYFLPKDLEAVYNGMQEYMADHNLSGVPKDEFIRFVNGLLHRMRIRGGVDHPYMERFRTQLDTFSLNWSQSKTHILARHYGPKSRFPKLVSFTKTNNDMTDAIESRSNKRSWFFTYYDLALPSTVIRDKLFIIDFYKELFRVLTALNITTEVTSREGANFALNPDKIMVTTKVKHLRCSDCQSLLCIGEEDKYASDIHCLFNACKGWYSVEEPIELNYYHNVYSRDKAPRIFSHEHTGMLDREVREQVEQDFKERPKADSINTLVATSTLEMGIDIGSLNNVINTDCPPLVSNFLQRVGRAGRDSGTALVIDFARNKPHDLFYYEEPMEMMKGRVLTPGCFLSAKDILRRHFFAYCIDCWTGENPSTNTIPPIIRLMGLSQNFMTNPDFFINRIFAYINEHLSELKQNFERQYAPDVQEAAIAPLYATLGSNGSFEAQVKMVFQHLLARMEDIKQKARDITDYIRTQKIATNNPLYNELDGQRRSLCSQIGNIRKQKVLEFMTDEGLLPNYSFPEKGVKLTANVKYMPQNSMPGGKRYYSEVIELVRPAVSAIRELAPGNFYYSGKYRLVVDGVETYDWNLQDSSLTKKRFCSKCDYIEDESAQHAQTCPKCGDASFGSDSNVHDFVKMNSAKSDMMRRDALSGDRSDERDITPFRNSSHFIFEKKYATVAYGMKNIPFGIEFVKNVKLTEVNLGDTEQHSSSTLDINGMHRVPRSGFVTCRYCGKTVHKPEMVMNMQDREKALKEWHYPYCKHKDVAYGSSQSASVFKEVFFYREIQTEAIKVLLPVQQIDTEATIAMFKAGIELGMKKYFQGNPSHIRMKDYQEWNENTNKFDQYIVMYDTIPGGTGYLAKLFDTTEFSKVIHLAHESIRDCGCQYDGKDGCYHCILSYGNQFIRNQLSRQKAERLFERIANETGDWKQFTGSLGTMVGDGGLEESELEERFVHCLKKAADMKQWGFEILHDNGMRYYKLLIREGDAKRCLMLYPQRWIGPEDGVQYQTRPDFYAVCTEWTVTGANGETQKDCSEIPDIAIYLDGYQYHGSSIEDKIRFFRDIEQRKALRSSMLKNIISWTITWDDLDIWGQENETARKDSLAIDNRKFSDTISFMTNYMEEECVWNSIPNNMERLLHVLGHIETMDNLEPSVAHYLMQWNQELGSAKHNLSTINTFINQMNVRTQGNIIIPIADLQQQDIDEYYSCEAAQDTSSYHTNIALIADNNTSDEEIIPEVIYQIITQPTTENLEKDKWNHFWRLYNLLNLGDNEVMKRGTAHTDSQSSSVDIDEILDNYPGVEDAARCLLEHHISINPEGGFELVVDDEVIGSAMLGSEELKIVIEPLDEDSKRAFENNGYTVVAANDIETIKNIIQ